MSAPWKSLGHPAWMAIAIGLATSCATPEEVEPDFASTDASPRGAESHDEEESTMCEDPREPEHVPQEVIDRPPSPPAPVAPGAFTRGGQLHFDVPTQREIVTVYEHLVDPDDDTTTQVTHDVGGYQLTVVAAGEAPPRPATGQTIVVVPGPDLRDFKLALDVSVLPDVGKIWFQDIRVEDVEGRAVGHADQNTFASEPVTCGEHALLRFGEIPAGMPSFSWPINKNCLDAKCLQVRTAYVEAVHATWRMTQMLDPLAEFPSYSRSWAWDQPAATSDGMPAGSRTSLRYYFGSYRNDRYTTIRELYRDHLNVLRTGRMDGIDLRLKCPTETSHPGNACNTGSMWAHHWVKGWVNMCPRVWSRLDDFYSNDEESWLSWFNHTLGHEFFHHHWVNIDGVGWRMVKDTVSHRHGNACLNTSTEQMISQPGGDPYDAAARHLGGYVNGQDEGCGHRRVALRTLDNYNTAARVIGERVRSGEIVWWPYVEPTPQPPQCVGGEGCRCDEVDPTYDEPDGDAGPDSFCIDNGNDLQCMERAFGAGNPVGICTDCDDVRGPGCECRDGHTPCDVGSCFGDDTRGQDMSWGRCYIEPPEYACLVDCEELLGSGATCLWNHPGEARCVPNGVGLPEASNCWDDGGHLNGEGECVQYECGPEAPDAPDGTEDPNCQDLGYPPYFVCDDSFRCVRDL